MSIAPQPPLPPAAPQPPRPGSHVLAIVLLVLGIIVLTSVVAVWTGLRFLSRNVQFQVNEAADGKKEVSIKSPVFSLDFKKGTDEAHLGMPVYPGATRVNDDAASVNLQFGGKEGVRLVVMKFETPDPLDKVKAFYHDRLGNEVTKFTEKDSDGKTVFEIKKEGNEKIVALSKSSGNTRIEMVRVLHGRSETN